MKLRWVTTRDACTAEAVRARMNEKGETFEMARAAIERRVGPVLQVWRLYDGTEFGYWEDVPHVLEVLDRETGETRVTVQDARE